LTCPFSSIKKKWPPQYVTVSFNGAVIEKILMEKLQEKEVKQYIRSVSLLLIISS